MPKRPVKPKRPTISKTQAVLGAVLILVIIGCATAAILVWKRQQLTALLTASVPDIPDLSRWPDAFSREVRDATAKARSGSDPVGSLTRLADLYLANSYVVQAKPPLAALCRLEPSNAQWNYLMADVHMRLGETNAAEARFQETTKLDPKYAKAWIRLGLLRTQQGAAIEAHECYASAAAANPDDLMYAYLLLEFELRNGGGNDVSRRIVDFSSAHPGYKESHKLLAELYDTSGDKAAAASERRTAAATSLHLDDEDPWVDGLVQYCFDANRLKDLSLVAFTQARLVTAEDLLKRAIRIAPKDALLWDALYSVYEAMGRPEDALRTLQQAVIECPDDPNLYVQLSRLLCSLHRPDEAVASIRPAVQRWPANAELHAALGFALNNAGKNDQAVAELREAIGLDSTQVEVRFNLGVGLLALGQRAAARASVQMALDMRPDYTDALTFLSYLALEDSDLAAAEPVVNRLYSLQPDNPKSQSLFCGLQLLKGTDAEQAGNPADAERAYRAGLTVAPNDWRLLRAEGLLALRQDRFSDAVECLRGYVQAKPGQTEAYFMLGQALRKAGQADEGRKVLQQGLKLEQQNGGNSSKVEAFKHALEQQ